MIALRAMRDVPKYDSAETLAFLRLIEKLLVSASGTTRSPPGLSGWEQIKASVFRAIEKQKL